MAPNRIMRTLTVSALATVCLFPIARAHADEVTDWNVIALNATAVPPELDPAIARARDCPLRNLRRGRAPSTGRAAPMRSMSRRRPELRWGCGCRSRLRDPGAARARGAAHAGRRAECQPVQDRRRARQDRRHRARPTSRRKNRGAAQHRWRRHEGRVHRQARHWPLSAHPAPIASPRSWRNGARSRRSCCAAERVSTSRARPP